MPDGTCSAIPAHLLVLSGVALAGSARLRIADGALAEALARLVHSGSAARPGPGVLALVGDYRAHHRAVADWADRVGDVGRAFAVAGAGDVGRPLLAGPGSAAGVVRAGAGAIAALLALPGGHARSLEELRALSPDELVAWFRGLQRLEGFDDPNFRAVEGLLLAVVAGGRHGGAPGGQRSIFDEPGFDLADAEVLLSMQDGWLAASGVDVPARHDTPSMVESHAAAVVGWAAYFRLPPTTPESTRDERWAVAEETSVRTAEALLRERGLGFGPGMLALVPFTHSFRVAVATDEEGALLASVLDTVDLRPLRGRVAEVAGAMAERLVEEHPGVVDHLAWWVAPLNPALAAGIVLADRTGVADEVAGELVEAAVDAVPVELAGRLPELLELHGLGDVLDVVGELLVDPSATPPAVVRRVLDAVVGHEAPAPDASAAYYLARLVDLGYLPGIGDGRPFRGAVPDPLPTAG